MDEQGIRLPLRKTRKIGFQLTGLADSKRFDLDIACLSCNLDMFKQNRTEKRVSIHEHCDSPRNRQHLDDQFEILYCEFGGRPTDTSHVSARPGDVGNQSRCLQISPIDDNGQLGCYFFGGKSSRRWISDDDINLAPDQVGGKRRKSRRLAVGGANDQLDASSLLISEITQTLTKPHHKDRWIGISKKQNADPRDLALLGERREWPCCCRAAEQAHKLPPLHSITSSARTRNDSGIFRPIAFAVFRFTTNSNLTGICTGRSVGFAPRRTWSMEVATCRHASAGTFP